MAYQGILFDLDGTLVDSIQDLYLATNLMLSDLARPIISLEMAQQFVGNGMETLVKRALSGDMQINSALTTSQVDQAIALFEQHYQQVAGQHSQLYPYVDKVLPALSHLPKAIVTNKPRVFTEKLLEQLELTPHFNVVVCGDDMEKKPSPTPLLFACEQLGVAPENTLMIGDSKSDILASQRANIDVLALTYGYNQGENLASFNPQYLCDSFLDIMPAINQHS